MKIHVILKVLLKNPFSTWIRWLFCKCFYEVKYAGKHLKIYYLAQFKNCSFGNFNILYDEVKLNQVGLGDYTYISSRTIMSRVVIGKFCCIGPDVRAGLGKHPAEEFVSTHPIFYSPSAQCGITFASRAYFQEFDNIVVGHDVWIGARAILLEGISVGNGAIIAAGAVVTKDVPPYAVVAGVPARVLRYRFNQEQINMLERIEWWNRDLDWLKRNARAFLNTDDFLRLHAQESTFKG